MTRFGVISGSLGTTHSGSIYKVQAMADSVLRIEFSKQSQQSETEYTAARSVCDNVPLSAGFTIEGPIGRVKVISGGSLVFFGKHGK